MTLYVFAVHGLDLGKMQDREPQIDNRYQTSEMLSGLLSSTKYRVYIWARTARGRGEGYFIELVTTKKGRKLEVLLAVLGVVCCLVQWCKFPIDVLSVSVPQCFSHTSIIIDINIHVMRGLLNLSLY